MLVTVFISMLFKLLHFWFAIAKELNLFVPNIVYLSISLAELTALFMTLKLIKNNYVRLGIAFSLNITLGVLITANYLYIRMFSIPLSFSLVLFIRNIGDIASSIFSLLKPGDVSIFAIDAFFIISLIIPKIRKRLTKTDNFFLGIPNKIVAFALILLIVLWALNVQPRGSWKEPFCRQEMQALITFSPIGFCILEPLKLIFQSNKLTNDIKNQIKRTLESENELYKNCKRNIPYLNKSEINMPNIFIIQVESLMSEYFDKFVDGIEVLPTLNKLRMKSVYLPNFFSCAISTADSEFSTLTSLLPAEVKIAHLSYYDNTFESLPKILKSIGYYSLYANSASKTFWNEDVMTTTLGFNKKLFKENLKTKNKIGPWLSDKDFFKEMLLEIDKAPKPLLGVFLTLSSHHPFNFKELPRVISTDGKKGDDLQMRQYANAINYADSAIGEFLKQLKEKGYLNNSIIFIYGDHPIVLNYQRKMLYKKLSKLPNASKLVQYFDSNVPCLIYAPKLLKPKVINKYCGQIDLGPTILSILGVAKPEIFLGKSVFADTPSFSLHKFTIGQTKNNFFYGHFWEKDGFRYCYDKSFKPVKQTKYIERIFKIRKVSEMILKYNYH